MNWLVFRMLFSYSEPTTCSKWLFFSCSVRNELMNVQAETWRWKDNFQKLIAPFKQIPSTIRPLVNQSTCLLCSIQVSLLLSLSLFSINPKTGSNQNKMQRNDEKKGKTKVQSNWLGDFLYFEMCLPLFERADETEKKRRIDIEIVRKMREWRKNTLKNIWTKSLSRTLMQSHMSRLSLFFLPFFHIIVFVSKWFGREQRSFIKWRREFCGCELLHSPSVCQYCCRLLSVHEIHFQMRSNENIFAGSICASIMYVNGTD